MDYRTDSNYLKNEQYKDSQNLGARIAIHHKYSVREHDLHDWAFDLMLASTRPKADVLECGTGRGDLWSKNIARLPQDWRMTLTDLSAGMLSDARERIEAQSDTTQQSQFTWQESDVQALPFEDDSFDMVVANFMLYHVPDLAKGIEELKRVLRPDGVLHAFTLGKNHMLELHELLEGIFGVDMSAVRHTGHFSLENGEASLRQHFSDIQMIRYESNLAVTNTDDLMAYIASAKMSEFMDDAKRQEARQQIDARIAEHGHFYIHKDTAVFIARP
jgi:ubiquinone/menaquinone biosynthesis C-methylase UbiE